MILIAYQDHLTSLCRTRTLGRTVAEVDLAGTVTVDPLVAGQIWELLGHKRGHHHQGRSIGEALPHPGVEEVDGL